METRHARLVREIAETGRFSLASERLGIGQPALSKIIRRIEDEFGVKLFERGPKGATLTPFGHTFLEYAQLVERETEDLMATTLAMRKGESGHYRIAAGQTWMHDLIPAILARVVTERPGLRVNVRSGNVPDMLELLAEGRIDLAFVSLTVRMGDEFCVEELNRDHLSIIARRGHPLVLGDGPPSLSEMLRYGWIVSEANKLDLGYRWLASAAERQNLPPPKVVVETNQRNLLIDLVKNTDLLAFQTSKLLAVASGELVVISERRIMRERGAGIVWRRGRPVPPGLAFIMDVARSVCTERQQLFDSEAGKHSGATEGAAIVATGQQT